MSTSPRTPTRRSSSTKTSRHRGPRRAVQRLRRRDRVLRPVVLALRVDDPSGRPAKERAAPDQHGSGGAPFRAAPATSLPTRRCSTRAACTRSSSGITPATRRRWWSGSAACPPSSSSQIAKAWAENSGRERTAALVYSVGLDAAHGGRAVHPRRGDHSAAAGQYRQTRRRRDRAARAREHPGFDGRADAVQPVARVSRDAEGGRSHAVGLPRSHHGPEPERLLAQRRCVHGLAAQGVLGRDRHRGERLLLRLHAAHQR